MIDQFTMFSLVFYFVHAHIHRLHTLGVSHYCSATNGKRHERNVKIENIYLF